MLTESPSENANWSLHPQVPGASSEGISNSHCGGTATQLRISIAQ